MAPVKEYTFEEIQNLTVEDIRDPFFYEDAVRIKGGWDSLSADQQRQCEIKLAALKNQDNQETQFPAVDPNDLASRLEQLTGPPSEVDSPRSPTSDSSRSSNATGVGASPINGDSLAQDLEVEQNAHDALVEDGGRPCYPIELAFGILDNPGQFEEIISYWKAARRAERCILKAQLDEWRVYRKYQQRERAKSLRANTFSLYRARVREDRYQYGYTAPIELREDQSQQSELDNWMEYQAFKLHQYKNLETKVATLQTSLASARQAMAEAGLSGYENRGELPVDEALGLNIEHRQKRDAIMEQRDKAEQQMKMAQQRLELAASDRIGNTIERQDWLSLFQKEVDPLLARLEALPNHEYIPEEWSHRGKHYRRRNEPKRDFDARHLAAKARRDQVFAEQLQIEKEIRPLQSILDASRLDISGASITRTALIEFLQNTVRVNRLAMEAADAAEAQRQLEGAVIGALGDIWKTKQRVQLHEVLLDWVEQQRQMIAGEQLPKPDAAHQAEHSHPTGSRLENSTKSPSKRTPRNGSRSPTEPPGKPALSPMQPSKVSKPQAKKENTRRQARKPRSVTPIEQELEAVSNQGSPEPAIATSKQLPKTEATPRGRARPTHDASNTGLDVDDLLAIAEHKSSPRSRAKNKRSPTASDQVSEDLHRVKSARVEKPSGKRSPGGQPAASKESSAADTRRRGRKGKSDVKKAGGNATRQNPGRRSSRTRKAPERFSP